MNGLVGFGILLLILWAVAFVFFKVAGFMIHILVIVAVFMLIAGLIRRVTGRRSSP
jgi:hypothetical protein